MRLMRRGIILLLAVLLGVMPAVVQAENEQVERHELLDAAFSMLERGNPFLTRYNMLTGALVEPRFDGGLPCFPGDDKVADDEELLFSRQPDYAKNVCGKTTGYYCKDQSYLYGLDADGFTQWILREAGWPAHDSLQAMTNLYGKYGKKNHVYSHRRGKEMPPYEEVAATLQIGDLLVTSRTTRHVMMFIGTLREYGYTPENAPELAEYLDYTLVIHCGSNPDYGPRMKQYLAAQGDDPYYDVVNAPEGGVAVSIIGMEPEAAPHQVTDNGTVYSYFDLEGYRLTVWDLEAVDYFCWFRLKGI